MSFTDLPKLFNLFQSRPCNHSKDGSCCTCGLEGVQKKPEPPIVDKRLHNWEKWMKRRRFVHKKLGGHLQRDPGSLLMNSADEFRFVKEEKLALEYTKIPEPDAYRGCPGFWKLPISLKDKCGEEVYFSVVTKEDLCEIPVIEHVGISNQLLKEKDVLPRRRNSNQLWRNLPYVQHKISELSRRLKQVDPHKPDFTDLSIEGNSLEVLADSVQKQSSKLGFYKTKSSEFIHSARLQEVPSKLSLSINGLHLSPNLKMAGTRKVYVFFDYDLNERKMATEYLMLNNLGSSAIRFYWKASERVEYFKDIIQDAKHEIRFYFDKNEGLILPGQTLKFPIWFQTTHTATSYEQWEFYTKPNVMPANTNLIVVLHASAVSSSLNENMEIIREQLNKNVRDNLIRELLSTTLSNISYDKTKPTVYSYNKKEIFEAINSEYDPFNRRPKYIYNRDIVRELQKFYKKIRTRFDPRNWNYNIDELRLLTRARQREEELFLKTAKTEESKKIFEARPRSPKLVCTRTDFPSLEEGTSKAQSNTKRSNTKLNQNKMLSSKGKCLTEELELIISKLERAVTDKNVEETKYMQAYLILCTCFSRFGWEIEDLKYRLAIIKKTNYPKLSFDYKSPLYYKPSRLAHETLDEVLQGPSLMAKVGTREDQPVAEILKDIPKEDLVRKYKMYFNLSDTPGPNADKKGKADNKGGKEDKKADKKKEPTKTDSDEEDKYVVNVNFDPYAKVNLPKLRDQFVEDVDETESNLDKITPTVLRQFKYNLYVIMYNCLNQAITNIVDMIEMQPREHLPYPIIKELEEPKYRRRLVDLKDVLAEENALQFKSELVLYKYCKYSKKDWRTIEIQRQLRHAKSDSSLWSILRPYEIESKLPEKKPVSYPADCYGDFKKTQSMDGLAFQSTLTSESYGVDPNWENYKNLALQKNYGEKDRGHDLEEYIEEIVSRISAQNLVDFKLDKATQKKSSEHVSDEEYFYDSESDVNSELISESSIDSEVDSELLDSCNCEGLGICVLPVEEEYSGEKFGECNLSIEKGTCNISSLGEKCSCGGYGECQESV